MTLADRAEAGRLLAGRLSHLKRHRPAVLALPRGGVAVGFEIARALAAPLDIVVVRKIGAPWSPELALGAVADGAEFVDRAMVSELGVPDRWIAEETGRQRAEVERRRALYGAGRAPLAVAGRAAIIVDDGIATGATMRVALAAVRQRGPQLVVLAVPVAPPDTLATLAREVDEAVALETPADLGAIGYYYEDFHQLTDAEVSDLLARAPPPRED